MAIVPAFADSALNLQAGDPRMGGALASSTSGNPWVGKGEEMNSRTVATLPLSFSLSGEWDVILGDCEGCFSALLQSVDHKRLLQSTRTVILENDDSDLKRQSEMHTTLKSLGFELAECEANHFEQRATRVEARVLLVGAYAVGAEPQGDGEQGDRPQGGGILAKPTTLSQLGESYLVIIEQSVTGSLFDELGAYETPASSTRSTRNSTDRAMNVVPFDPKLREEGHDFPVAGHTMVGHKRLQNVRMALEAVVADGIPGDFVELGVWRGGVLHLRTRSPKLTRRHQSVGHLFDAFDLVPQVYGNGEGERYFAVSEEQVRHNFDKYGLLDESTVTFHKGLFEDSIPQYAQASDALIAVLRIDTNGYAACRDTFARPASRACGRICHLRRLWRPAVGAQMLERLPGC